MTQTVRRPDADLQRDVIDEIKWIPGINSTHIGVAVNDGAVTLSGEVDSYPEMLLAGCAAQRIHGVIAIAQEITVRSTGGGQDTGIAREAGEAIQRAVDVPDSVKVAVHHHVVTLTGEVEWKFERDAAERAVRYGKGIRTVVNAIAVRPGSMAAGVKEAIGAALVRNAQLEGKHITVTADSHGLVTLDGTVRSWAERRQAEHTAFAAPGVVGVANHLHIEQ